MTIISEKLVTIKYSLNQIFPILIIKTSVSLKNIIKLVTNISTNWEMRFSPLNCLMNKIYCSETQNFKIYVKTYYYRNCTHDVVFIWLVSVAVKIILVQSVVHNSGWLTLPFTLPCTHTPHEAHYPPSHPLPSPRIRYQFNIWMIFYFVDDVKVDSVNSKKIFVQFDWLDQ